MPLMQSVVVGIDFSPASVSALAHAARLATAAGARLHAVHALGAAVAADPGLPGRWEQFRRPVAGAAGVALEVLAGPGHSVLEDAIRRHGADLLVLGARGEGGAHVGLGTLASRCIRSVPVDVLVVRDDRAGTFRTVAAGIDFSETSRRALAWAENIARRDAARLYAVHVVPALDGSRETQARLAAEFGPALDEFVAGSVPAEGIGVRREVFPYTGHRSGLIEFCAVVDADLLVIGTRGRGNLREALLGSTAEKALELSTCAVLAVKPPTG
jgi:nucleotide-binding universal stress UspA family protein